MTAGVPLTGLLILLAAATVGRAADGDASVTVNARAKARLQSEFTFDPSLARTESAIPEDEVVTMPTLTVSASLQHRHLARVVLAQEQRFEAKQYSVLRGGTILEKEIGPAKIELGGWSIGPGLGLLKISW